MGDCVSEHAEDGEGCGEGDCEGAGQGQGARGQEEEEEGARELLQVSGKVGGDCENVVKSSHVLTFGM